MTNPSNNRFFSTPSAAGALKTPLAISHCNVVLIWCFAVVGCLGFALIAYNMLQHIYRNTQQQQQNYMLL